VPRETLQIIVIETFGAKKKSPLEEIGLIIVVGCRPLKEEKSHLSLQPDGA